MAEIPRFLKETGKIVIGKGPEIKFRRLVRAEMRRSGCSHADAQREIFKSYAHDIGSDLGTTPHVLTHGNKNWRKFEAALNEMCSKKEKKHFRELAEVPGGHYRDIPAGTGPGEFGVPLKKEIDDWKKYLKDKYGEEPDSLTQGGILTAFRLMRHMSARIESDLASGAPIGPEQQADLGKMMNAREVLKRREINFRNECASKKSVEALKTSAKKDLLDFFIMNGFNEFKDFFKGIKLKPLPIAGRLVKSIVKFAGKEIGSLSKFGWHSGETILRKSREGAQKVRGRNKTEVPF